MIYKHNEWTVEVSQHKDFRQESCDVVFRRTLRQGRKCELFTLLKKNEDDALIQIQMFDDGSTHCEVYSPSLVQIDPNQKFVLIGLFDTSNWDKVPCEL